MNQENDVIWFHSCVPSNRIESDNPIHVKIFKNIQKRRRKKPTWWKLIFTQDDTKRQDNSSLFCKVHFFYCNTLRYEMSSFFMMSTKMILQSQQQRWQQKIPTFYSIIQFMHDKHYYRPAHIHSLKMIF